MARQFGNKILFDRSSDLKYIYVGRAACGSAEDEPVWIIKRIELSVEGNFKNLTFAEDDALIGVKWVDRETLVYR